MKAIYWFQKAAKSGNAKAQYNLGLLYEKGDGVSKNLRKAVKWYHRAAEQDHQKAQANLGWMYVNGMGVKEDFDEAAKWYKRSENLEKPSNKKHFN